MLDLLVTGGGLDWGLDRDDGCFQRVEGHRIGDGGLIPGGLGGDDGHRTVLLHRRRGWGFLGGLQKVMGKWKWSRE